jgi:hypothetical protein
LASQNEQKNTSTSQAVVAPAVAASVVTQGGLSDEQFGQLLKTIAYGFVVMGIVNNNPGTTPSAKNLDRVKQLGDAVLELVKQ